MKISRVIKICFLIWAASAAQFSHAQWSSNNYFRDRTTALETCRSENGGTNCSHSTPRYFYNDGTGNQYFHYSAGGSGSFCPSQMFETSSGYCIATSICPVEWDDDGNHCQTGTNTDLLGFHEGGYDENNCMPSGTCPGDNGWTDVDGYDLDGFNGSGFDRGGKTRAQGGGYGGSAGTGGTPPTGWTPPEDPDFQNGENESNNGIMMCHRAYPVTISKSLLPGSVIDGLAGCGNGCQYQPSGTHYDFDYDQEVVSLTPNGNTCTGAEPNITGLDVSTYTEPEIPVDANDTLNHCYLQGGRFFCQGPNDSNPTCYNKRSNGTIGLATGCGSTPDSNRLCGTYNGIYQCFPPNSQCESYNGVILCVNPNTGGVIDQSDPDHVINGGNTDGNSNNDVFADANDVTNNGQPTQDRIVNQLNSRELARQIARDLQPEFDRITDSLNSTVQVPDGVSTANDALTRVTDGLQAVSDPSSALSFDGNGIFNPLNDYSDFIPTGTSCANFDFNIYPEYGMTLSIDTCLLHDIRTVMEYMLYALTLIALYYMLFNTRKES